jgi:hypothetical protein
VASRNLQVNVIGDAKDFNAALAHADTTLKRFGRTAEQQGRIAGAGLSHAGTKAEETTGKVKFLEHTISHFGPKSAGHIQGVTKEFGKMGVAAGVAGGAFAGMYTAFEAVKKSLETTQTLYIAAEKLHQTFGLSAQISTNWAASAQVMDVSNQKLITGFNMLAKAAATANGHTKAAATQRANFKALGLSRADVRAGARPGGFQGLLTKVGEGIEKAPGGVNRAQLVRSAFGARAGVDIMRILGDQKNTLGAAQRYLPKVDGKSLSNMKQLHDYELQAKFASIGLQMTLAKTLTPALLKLGHYMEWLSNHHKTLKRDIDILGKTFQVLLIPTKIVYNQFKLVGDLLHGKFKQAFGDVANILTGPFKTALKVAGVNMAALGDSITSVWRGVRATVIGFINDIIGAIDHIPGVNIHKISTGSSTPRGNSTTVDKHGNVNTIIGKAGGGFLGGVGRRDTVPIMAAPGEAILNRHQQGPVNAGLAAIGIRGGLPELFQKVQTPHYMAGGGMIQSFGLGGAVKGVVGKGLGALGLPHAGNLGFGGAIGSVVSGLTHFLISKAAHAASSVFGGGGGSGNVHGLQPIVLRAISQARSHGWGGSVTSGFRTFAEQQVLYARYLAGGNLAAKPGTSMHERGLAVDVTDPAGFRAAQHILKWFGPGDAVHFSTTGHAKGGFVNGSSTGAGKSWGASMFGGPSDPGTGHIGYRGDDLNSKWDSFAELGMGNALGGLPYGAALNVTGPNGKTLKLYKRDIGKGGGPVNGKPRAIDLWYKAAQKLGIHGLGVVRVGGSDANMKKIAGTNKAAGRIGEGKVKFQGHKGLTGGGFGAANDWISQGQGGFNAPSDSSDNGPDLQAMKDALDANTKAIKDATDKATMTHNINTAELNQAFLDMLSAQLGGRQGQFVRTGSPKALYG